MQIEINTCPRRLSAGGRETNKDLCQIEQHIKYDIVQSLVVRSVVPPGAWLNHINSASVVTSDKRELAEKMISEDMQGQRAQQQSTVHLSH